MAGNSDHPKSARYPSGQPQPGTSQEPAEDPLVELARIVHRNKQPGASVTGNRVGSTDYFAGLDEVAGGPTSQPAAPATPGPAADRAAPPVAETPVAQTPSQPAADNQIPWPKTPDLGSIEATAAQAMNRSVDPARAPSSRGVGFLPTGEPPLDDLANAPRPAPSVTADLEKSLTAELEDELIGAFRQNFDTAPDPLSAAPQQSEMPPASPAYSPPQDAAFDVKPVAAPPLQSGVAASQEPAAPEQPARPDAQPQRTEPYFGSGFASNYGAPANDAKPAIDEDDLFAAISQPEASLETSYELPATPAPEAQSVKSPAPRAPTSDPAASERAAFDPAPISGQTSPPVAGQAPEMPKADPKPPQGPDFDSLFADLKLPDFPVSRQEPAVAPHEAGSARTNVSWDSISETPAASRPVAEEPLELRGSDTSTPAEDDIDNMTWPAAAASVPQSGDDELPPPPGGYDLDAVARAMNESDPTVGTSGVLPPHPPAEKAAAPGSEPRSRKGLMAAAAVLGIAVIGGGAFVLLDDDSVAVPDGPPPIIAGLQGDLKVYPDNQQAASDDQGAKLIYDRVGGLSDPSRERLVLPETAEPAQLRPAPENTATPDPLVPGAPKKVRTLVVRPDGSIVNDGDQPRQVSTSPVAQPSAPASPTNPSAPVTSTITTAPVTTTPIPSSQDNAGPSASGTDIASAPATPQPAQPSTPAIVGTQTGTDGQTSADASAAQAVAPADIPTVTPRAKPPAPVRVASAPQPVATDTSSGPLNLTNPAPAPAAATPAPVATASGQVGQIASGTYIVQVTSQRSAEAARNAYAGLQRQYPSVLGNRTAVIVSADLGDRGTFYRARIPTTSRGEAISLCESLQAAGGDCFVRQN
ncbi:sporulation related protein [Roseibium hamelinense]|uniref:Sporulation related protein n=1 Tax=Roseibium hamelinense TaxID=150831 RepID=A0A562TIF4_9HYPH|nr:SPOR domain-containing protein [Roseibium hamelinense]MTI45663.1 hypothetical protein [Roseibium hamelinense]TWI93153.1 sporulation related protein [Roseibium hamelinense]